MTTAEKPIPPHLKRFGMSGFLCFKSQAPIELGCLNVFVGKNSTGKSTVLHALSLLAAAIEAPSPQTSMLFSGNGVNLGGYQDVIFNNDTSASFSFDMEVDLDGYQENLSSDPEVELGDFPNRYKITYRLDRASMRPYLSAVSAYASDLGRCFTLQGAPTYRSMRYHSATAPAYEARPDYMVPWVRNFLPRFQRDFEKSRAAKSDGRRSASRGSDVPYYRVNRVSQLYRWMFNGLVYLGPSRSPLDVVYFPAGAFPDKLDSTASNLVPLVLGRVRKARDKAKFWRVMDKWLGERFQLVTSATLKAYAEGYGFRLQGIDPTLAATVSLANTGYGVSQVLPLVVQLALAEPRMVLVEQPELHLHPAAQAELGDLLVDLAANGSQVFVETHSEHLVLRLRALAASGELASRDFDEGDIRLFHVEKQNAGSRIKEVGIGASGSVEGWPKGFFSASSDDLLKILRASGNE